MEEAPVATGPTEGLGQAVDVVIIGAGFAGLYMAYKLRFLGFTFAGFESAPEVGGVWFWNNYPGARCDGESLAYSYSFSEELQQEWEWPERFSAQPDILRYANHVADRFDLRPCFKFETRVTSAVWHEAKERWEVETDRGDRLAARFVVAAVGCLSAARIPEIPGIEGFQGEWYHTGKWPKEKVDFTGRRVGIVGTGSSAIQATPVIARDAARLTVFQRTPNYSVPSHNRPMDRARERHIKDNYSHYRYLAKVVGLGFVPLNDHNAFDVSAEEREAEFQKRWDYGGPLYMYSFKDMMVNRAANDAAADFIRRKIRETVKDPVTADLLSPKNYPIGAKRICVDTGYFETFNEQHVALVDIKSDPIAQVTSGGIELGSGRRFELDIIVFATGYDAMTGSLLRINFNGRGGQTLRDKWAAGPRTYLGLQTSGFPNLFIITGPGSPSVLGNVIIAIEQNVDWIGSALDMMRDRGATTIEPERDAEDRWVQHVSDLANTTLFPLANSWYLGANVPGKPRVFMPYVGGTAAYGKICESVIANGYEGFRLKGRMMATEYRPSAQSTVTASPLQPAHLPAAPAEVS